MSRFVIDTTDRIVRLKQRLGSPSKRWTIRIRIGGWISLTPPMLKSLRLSAGDVIEWKLTPRGIEWQRNPAKPGQTMNRLRRPGPLGISETVVYSCRPSCRRHYSGKSQSIGLPANGVAADNNSLRRSESCAVIGGAKRRFRKQPRAVSAKHFAMNFDRFLVEVMLGRVIHVKPRGGERCAFVPLGPKERIALRRKPPKIAHVSHKPSRRW